MVAVYFVGLWVEQAPHTSLVVADIAGNIVALVTVVGRFVGYHHT